MTSWIDFWNADNPIYVNDRHKTLHYRLIARDIGALIADPASHVLDYGCGEALSAPDIAARAARLLLCDGASNVRARLEAQFGGNPKIGVLAPADVALLGEKSLDLVVVHSVAQYLDRASFKALLETLARKIKPGGRLVLGDILPKDLSPVTDALSLLSFAFSGGFLGAALVGLVRTALSDYAKIRSHLGLETYDEAEMLALLEGLGLTARRLERNPGHNQHRMAFAAIRFE